MGAACMTSSPRVCSTPAASSSALSGRSGRHRLARKMTGRSQMAASDPSVRTGAFPRLRQTFVAISNDRSTSTPAVRSAQKAAISRRRGARGQGRFEGAVSVSRAAVSSAFDADEMTRLGPDDSSAWLFAPIIPSRSYWRGPLIRASKPLPLVHISSPAPSISSPALT